MSKPDFREAAIKYAKDHSMAPDKETPDWIINDFINGAHKGYSLAMEQHRDFYLLVREYFKEDVWREAKDHSAILTKIEKHLAAFTSRELESLPFKD
jgi:hypothetical protein